jgi:predicted metalloendopeptidase
MLSRADVLPSREDESPITRIQELRDANVGNPLDCPVVGQPRPIAGTEIIRREPIFWNEHAVIMRLTTKSYGRIYHVIKIILTQTAFIATLIRTRNGSSFSKYFALNQQLMAQYKQYQERFERYMRRQCIAQSIAYGKQPTEATLKRLAQFQLEDQFQESNTAQWMIEPTDHDRLDVDNSQVEKSSS